MLEGFAAEDVIFCSENFKAHVLWKKEGTRLNELHFTSLKHMDEVLRPINEILKDAEVLATSDLMRRSH